MDWTIDTIIETVQELKYHLASRDIDASIVFVSDDVFLKMRQSGGIFMHLEERRHKWLFMGLEVFIVRQPLLNLSYFIKVV